MRIRPIDVEVIVFRSQMLIRICGWSMAVERPVTLKLVERATRGCIGFVREFGDRRNGVRG